MKQGGSLAVEGKATAIIGANSDAQRRNLFDDAKVPFLTASPRPLRKNMMRSLLAT